MSRRAINWDSIEDEYRAGQLSIREIARRHNVANPTIVQRAKRYNWTRDLSEKIRQRVNAKVGISSASSSEASTNTSTDLPPRENQLSEDEIIEAASERGRQAVEGHLAKAERLKQMADKLAAGLEAHMRNEDPGFNLFPGKGDCLSSLLRSLADLTERIVNLERKALNLDEHDINQTQILIMVD